MRIETPFIILALGFAIKISACNEHGEDIILHPVTTNLVGKQLPPKGGSFMVSSWLPPACGLLHTLPRGYSKQTCRDFDCHCSQRAAGFHKNI